MLLVATRSWPQCELCFLLIFINDSDSYYKNDSKHYTTSKFRLHVSPDLVILSVLLDFIEKQHLEILIGWHQSITNVRVSYSLYLCSKIEERPKHSAGLSLVYLAHQKQDYQIRGRNKFIRARNVTFVIVVHNTRSANAWRLRCSTDTEKWSLSVKSLLLKIKSALNRLCQIVIYKGALQMKSNCYCDIM